MRVRLLPGQQPLWGLTAAVLRCLSRVALMICRPVLAALPWMAALRREPGCRGMEATLLHPRSLARVLIQLRRKAGFGLA